MIDEAVPAKVTEYLGTGAAGDEPNYAGLLNWVNITFPLGLTKEKAQFETRTPEENAQFLIEKIKEAYERKSSHEEPTAVKSLERYIILNAIDRLWQEHLYAMDALREGVYLRAYAQKDPLIEYKTEAYEMFVELMANIKNEVLHNLFPQHLELAGLRELSLHSAAISHAGAGRDRSDRQRPAAGTAARANRQRDRWQWRGGRRRRGKIRTRSGAPRDAEGWAQRAMSLRQRKEIQELLRPHRLTTRPFFSGEHRRPACPSRCCICLASPAGAAPEGRNENSPALQGRGCSD